MAARATNFVAHLQDELNRQEAGDNFQVTSTLMIFDSGKQATYTGTGKALADFIQDLKLRYTGFGNKPTEFYDYHFDDAALRYLKFDESFHTAPGKDCTSSELISLNRMQLIVHASNGLY